MFMVLAALGPRSVSAIFVSAASPLGVRAITALGHLRRPTSAISHSLHVLTSISLFLSLRSLVRLAASSACFFHKTRHQRLCFDPTLEVMILFQFLPAFVRLRPQPSTLDPKGHVHLAQKGHEYCKPIAVLRQPPTTLRAIGTKVTHNVVQRLN